METDNTQIQGGDIVRSIWKHIAALISAARLTTLLEHLHGQYGAGPTKLQRLLKCSADEAEQRWQSYHNLYSGITDLNYNNKIFAKANGYVECAFGHKVYTPNINAKDMKRASKDARSSSNAVTQSWGMLTNRAINEFDERLTNSPYRHDVKLINTIHDAIYLLIRENAEAIKWVNDNLMECMKWQDHPLIASDIPLTAELDLGYSWDAMKTLDNNVELEEVQKFISTLRDP